MRLFTKTEIKLIGLVVAGTAVLAVAITVAVMLGRREGAGSPVAGIAAGELELPYVTDLVIPEEFTLTGGERWYFSREPLKAWSEEQVDLYWIDPAEISIDLVQEETNRTVREFVEELP